MKKATAHAPGKLYIAGEYAVVEAGQPAVIVAVNRFISVTVTPTDTDYGTIQTQVLSDQPLKWVRTAEGLSFLDDVDKADILKTAIDTVECYLSETSRKLSYYEMIIESEMVSEDGIKYGLGSSGAVTVAVIDALLKAHSIEGSSLLLYKLASLAHLSLNSNGSFGDLAAASFTGWIAYKRFDTEKLLQKMNACSIEELLEQSWGCLSIEALPQPENLSLLIGWTGSAASTESLVEQSKHPINPDAYTAFLEKSRACVTRLINALKNQDSRGIMREISLNRELLLEMAEMKAIELETPLLNTLCRVANDHLATAKTSGAGGGDCGIALIPKQYDAHLLTAEWDREGIVPLDLKVYDK